MKPEIKDRDAASRTHQQGAVAVVFEDVTFRYPGAEMPALSDISFTASAGEDDGDHRRYRLGQIDAFNLIPRFYDVSGGRIRIDGVDVRELSQAAAARDDRSRAAEGRAVHRLRSPTISALAKRTLRMKKCSMRQRWRKRANSSAG